MATLCATSHMATLSLIIYISNEIRLDDDVHSFQISCFVSTFVNGLCTFVTW